MAPVASIEEMMALYSPDYHFCDEALAASMTEEQIFELLNDYHAERAYPTPAEWFAMRLVVERKFGGRGSSQWNWLRAIDDYAGATRYGLEQFQHDRSLLRIYDFAATMLWGLHQCVDAAKLTPIVRKYFCHHEKRYVDKTTYLERTTLEDGESVPPGTVVDVYPSGSRSIQLPEGSAEALALHRAMEERRAELRRRGLYGVDGDGDVD